MAGFSTQLEDLRESGRHLGKAADAAGEAHKKVGGMDIPSGPRTEPSGPFGLDVITVPDNAFGTTLGMPAVAAAYDQHRQKIAKLLDRLRENTEATSLALSRVADLYEEADASTQSRLGRFSNQLDGI